MKTETLGKTSFEIHLPVPYQSKFGRPFFEMTNESVDQIVAALGPKEEDSLLAIIGGGEQILGLMEKVTKGNVVGIDYSADQVALAAVKLELISMLDRSDYIDLIKNFKEKRTEIKSFIQYLEKNISFSGIPARNIKEIVKSLGLIPLRHSYRGQTPLIEKMENFGFLQDDERYKKVKCSSSKIKLVCSDFLDYLNAASDSCFDLVYCSNVFDFVDNDIEKNRMLERIKRVLKPGGKLYCASRFSDMLYCLPLKKFFEEDKEGYQRGLYHSNSDYLGFPRGSWIPFGGDFFVGINNPT